MTPAIFLVTGLDEAAMLSTTLGLLLDQPSPVVVSYAVDVEPQELMRTICDMSGIIERKNVGLDHGCVSCTIREDTLRTLQRLVTADRWKTIIACLPAGANAMQICRIVAQSPGHLPGVEISAVLAALDGKQLADDLTGPDLLCERGMGLHEDDHRGVAEVLGGLVEHADVIAVIDRSPEPAHAGLVRTIARPDALLVEEWSDFDSMTIRCGVHDHDAVESWIADVPVTFHPEVPDGVWRLMLDSSHPMHPVRLQEQIGVLGAGKFRTRGAFWLPTRPQSVCQWDGAGGQLSIGTARCWGNGESPCSRLVMTGLLEHGDPRTALTQAFRSALVSDEEMCTRGRAWEVMTDGLEPWLGMVGEIPHDLP
ncbi:hypothetical protein HMPREF1531_02101 [Propionibacterium sp. oral taxon 192 str. F0372]|uniref:GTP-binding protein n=1 Tax=Propionibacterium sp. oral taxon 192 TaxID=671222 RepID=UPI000353CF7B|nr:GTP-binding protein [Propionibacterium sp. oral taxon 192]EPH02790.1 hypothetical protein HMPREF1531_02101 [Propionibacterium sp. oral taxon 192 str. F0372]